MVYKGENLREISFPLGGIGTGCIGVAGNGALIDWEIFNRPNKGSINGTSFFAVTAEYPDGRRVVRILRGDVGKDLMGQYSNGRFGGYGYGPSADTMCGFPHFENVVFDGRFPIAEITFSDSGFPGNVVLTAWSPFIPLDSENSSIPVALFDIKIEGGDKNAKYSAVLSVKNPFGATENIDVSNDKYTAVAMRCADREKDDPEYGDMTVAVGAAGAIIQKYWYRGGARDAVTSFWNEIVRGDLKDRSYGEAGRRDVCSVGAKINGGEKLRCAISWNVPNQYNYWDPFKDENGRDVIWKNYYATVFEDSTASCFYTLGNYDGFYKKTAAFRDSLFSSTLDPAVIDAAASNLSVLRSPTVMRLENGAFYGFEGVHEHDGSCEGTCTHVWSYAYALCFLFPDLERSIRETEFRYDVADTGRMNFRTKLPLGRMEPRRPQCVDGQMLTVVKSYREWKISGDDAWLKSNWKTIKKVLAYAWSEENYQSWDRDRDGVLEGRQHHTLDADLMGPSSWLEGLYLLALRAGAEMAEYLGETDAAADYRRLFESGYDFTRRELFNGKYFIHKIDVSDENVVKTHDCADYVDAETGEIKYQIGEGSEIDQMLAQWHSDILGLGTIFDKDQSRAALDFMMKHNFKPRLRDVPNMWRVFALEDEAGVIMCDYPEGARKPAIPVQYCEECMTGFEYAFAGLLVAEGRIEDGLRVVRAVRDRYDGKKRNPYSEIECGANYARSMASFALVPLFSGFKFDLPRKTVGFSPLISGDFRSVFSVGTGWGDFVRTEASEEITLKGGCLELSSVTLDNAESVKRVIIDGKDVAFERRGDKISFPLCRIEQGVVFKL